MLTVKKRSGQIVDFNFRKIEKAIRAAFEDPNIQVNKQENLDKIIKHLEG